MTIAILAHDSRKELALQFCTAYSAILSKNTVIATGTTGRMLAQTTGLPVHCYLSGRLGGVQQITSRIACDEVDLVLFFRDPLKADAASITEQNLLRLCDMHSVPIATNIATAEVLLRGMDQATWTTARGCIPLLWSQCPPCSATPCDESCIEYRERDSAAGNFLRRCCFLFCFYFSKACSFSSRRTASFSTSVPRAKCIRIRWFTGSRKKLEPGTAATPTSRIIHSQNCRSVQPLNWGSARKSEISIITK